MKRLHLAYIIGFSLLIHSTSCSEDSSLDENGMSIDEEATDDENEDTASNDQGMDDGNEDTNDGSNETNSMTPIELLATSDIITNNGEGSQEWGEGVTLTAIKIDGTLGRLVYDTQFRDEGFGVAGARWDQIDYYVMFQGEEVNASEKIEITFENEATDIVITVGMMGANEGHSDGETGKWTAFDQNQNQIATGMFGANESNLGPDVKLVEGSYGTYPISLDVAVPVHSIVVEATGFGYGQGNPRNVGSYDNESGNKENNSDFNLVGLSFKR